MSYLLGGGIVTEAGRKALAERELAERKLSVRLHLFLAINGATHPTVLVDTFEDRQHTRGMVREAMWVLLNKDIATVGADRRVTLIGQGSA